MSLTYEIVLDQALALSLEDRTRLVNQLSAFQQSSVFNTNDAIEYIPPLHPNIDWMSPMEWLRLNREQYQGQWIGLDGARLVAHGVDASEVFAELRAKGISLPFITYIPEESKENGARIFNFF